MDFDLEIMGRIVDAEALLTCQEATVLKDRINSTPSTLKSAWRDVTEDIRA